MNKEGLIKALDFIYENFPDSCFVYNNKKEEALDAINNEYSWIIEEMLLLFEEGKEGLPTCDCGTPYYTRLFIYKVLKSQRAKGYFNKKEQRDKIFGLDSKNEVVWGAIQFALYVLDSVGFVDHGSSINSAYLTKKGEIYFLLLEEYFRWLKEGEI